MLRVLAVLVLLLTGCTGAGRAAPAAAAPQSWTVELGTAPTLLALSQDAVLAASYGNGVGGSQVYRVDRATGRLAAQRTVAGQPNGMALGPDGALWLATVRLPDQSAGTGLQVLDPVTLQTRRTLPVAGDPLAVAFVDGALWTGSAEGVQELDPRTGQVLRSLPTAEPANRFLAAGGALLALAPRALQRVDLVAGEVTAVQPVPAAGSATATGDGRRLWVVHPDREARAVLQRYDPGTLQPGAAAPSPGRAGAVAHLDGDRLWVTDPGGGRLLCADPDSGALRAEREVPLTGPVVADRRSVVVAQAGGLTGLPADCD